MDTTFWGPPGHILFHSITYKYDMLPTQEHHRKYRQLCKFFESLGHILPCIYCRRSFKQYSHELPLRPFAKAGKTFEWYFRIHNMINDKLRRQGYLHTANPSLASVKQKYRKYLQNTTCFVGWNFLYSVIYHFPTEISTVRLNAYQTFFRLLAEFYPIESYREKYAQYLQQYPVEDYLDDYRKLAKWFYKFEKSVHPNCCSFSKKCALLEKYKVKKCANKSCRKNG